MFATSNTLSFPKLETKLTHCLYSGIMKSRLRFLCVLMISLNLIPALSNQIKKVNDNCIILTETNDFHCNSASLEDIIQASYNLSNVYTIQIQRSRLEPFGPTEWYRFRDARHIIISKMDLSKLPPTRFGWFKRLENVVLASDQIEVISQNVFPAHIIQEGNNTSEFEPTEYI